MPRTNDEAWYEVVEPPRFDEDGYDCSQYELVGSLPLSTWELMVMKAEQVSGLVDLAMEHLR